MGFWRSPVSYTHLDVYKRQGYKYALDGSVLVTKGKPNVTLNGTTEDNGSTPVFTGGTNGSIIMGGSVLEDYSDCLLYTSLLRINQTCIISR